MSNVYVGIDLSITSPGIAIITDNETILTSYTEKCKNSVMLTDDIYNIVIVANKQIHSSNKALYFNRIKHNAEMVVGLINDFLKDLREHNHIEFWIEGYSYGAVGRVFDIAEMGGVVKYLLEQEYQTKVNIVEPSVVKLFATGKGKATKEKIGQALMDENKVLELMFTKISNQIKGKRSKKNMIFESPLNDLTDAYFIAKYAMSQNNK